MRIAIQPPSGDLVWLAGAPGTDEREFSSAAEIRISGVAATQEDLYVRGKARRLRDRGNVGESISFTTVRKFATAAEAELWSKDYSSTMPRAGTLVTQVTTPAGGIEERFLPDCVISLPERRLIGCSVMLSYQVSGGQFTSTNPTP